MKANFILGKKHIILASLVLILGVAVYLNWQFASNNDKLENTKNINQTKTNTETENKNTPVLKPDKQANANVNEGEGETVSSTNNKETKPDAGKNLGDAKLVSAKIIMDNTYFQKANLTRNQSRDAAVDAISTILNDTKLTEAAKKQANEKAIAITDTIEKENEIENLIKAKGFQDCMVYYDTERVDVIVKSEGLLL
ncbi:MAG: SpoIIIAH-like family protein, partial [Oscillospiraceae bacterium]